MLRSLFAAISGMRSQQTKLDVIGNNIANVNTTGFKGGRVKFQDMLSQTIRSASAPMGGRGGTNPSQVGLGMTVAGIDTIHTPGSLMATGRVTDLAIQGGGFFVLSDGVSNLYSRDGAFSLSLSNDLFSSSSGLKVMGYMAEDGIINTQGVPKPMNIPIGEKVLTKATTGIELTGNLSNAAGLASIHESDVTVFDSKGAPHQMTIVFTKTAGNTWGYNVTPPAGMTVTSPAALVLEFDNYGNPTAATAKSGQFTMAVTGAENLAFTLDFNSLSQVAGDTTAIVKHQNGYPPGELMTFSIGKTGVVTGTYSNGLVSDLGQIALAFFGNAEGLLKVSGNMYDVSSNSGSPRIGMPGEEGRGTVETGMLEMSNVDLGSEFTEMITASRAFQANSRVVSTSDEMLQELIHLKR